MATGAVRVLPWNVDDSPLCDLKKYVGFELWQGEIKAMMVIMK